MTKKSTVAVYDNATEAKRAAEELEAHGFPRRQTSVVKENFESKTRLHEYVSGVRFDSRGAVRGVVSGAIVGCIVAGFIAWLVHTTNWLQLDPGSGLIGLGFTILTGVIVGALMGGVIGWSLGRAKVAEYQEDVESGHPVVVARGDEVQTEKAAEILSQTHPRELHQESGDPTIE